MWRLWCSLALVAAVLSSLTADAYGACDSSPLGLWTFDGTYDDVSPNQRGPAIGSWDREPVGGNIKLQWGGDASCAGYVHVGNPGYLSVPAVDFHNISFTFSFQVKLNGALSDRRILYADWSANKWQFMTFLTTQRRITVWFRNGAQQQLTAFDSIAQIPLGQWTEIAVVWDRTARTASIYINKLRSGYQTVPSNVIDLNLYNSRNNYYQFGAKADTSSSSTKDYAPLDADVRNLRVSKGFVLSAPEHPLTSLAI